MVLKSRRCAAVRRLAAAALLGLALLAAPLPADAAAPTGLRLAFVGDNLHSLFVLDPGAPEPTLVAWTGTSGLLAGSWVQDPSWSPDGKRIAYAHTVSRGFALTTGQVRVLTLKGRRDRAIVSLHGAGIPQHVTWSPDGRRIAFVLFTPNYAVGVATWTAIGSRWDLYVVNVDGTDLRLLAPLHPSGVGPPSWSPDGKKLAFATDSDGISTVHTVTVDGLPLTTRISPIGMVAYSPAWSPNGGRIAFLAKPLTSTTWPADLWVADSDGSDGRRLGADAWDPPTWSPDSRRIAFSDWTGIRVVAANGTSRPQRVTWGEDGMPSWSRAGDIVFSRNPGGYGDRECGLFTVRPGGQPRKLLSTCMAIPPLVWSPA